MWQLRDGRLAGLEAGCFLQADVASLGDAALAFIQRRLPLFNVPWRVREALVASGVTGCKTVEPKSIRCAPFLVHLIGQAVCDVGACNKHIFFALAASSHIDSVGNARFNNLKKLMRGPGQQSTKVACMHACMQADAEAADEGAGCSGQPDDGGGGRAAALLLPGTCSGTWAVLRTRRLPQHRRQRLLQTVGHDLRAVPAGSFIIV